MFYAAVHQLQVSALEGFGSSNLLMFLLAVQSSYINSTVGIFVYEAFPFCTLFTGVVPQNVILESEDLGIGKAEVMVPALN